MNERERARITALYAKPGIRIRMAADAPRAVIAVYYTGRKGRLMLWETDRDLFHPGQWVKGIIDIGDVTADGRYVGYTITCPKRAVPYYVGVSRPPYLTALYFRSIHPTSWGILSFSPGGLLERGGVPFDSSWIPEHPEYGYERVTEGCPFTIHPGGGDAYPRLKAEIGARDRERRAVREAIERYGPVAREVLEDPTKAAILFPQVAAMVPTMRKPAWYGQRPTTATWDHRGRLILVLGSKVFALDAPGAEPLELLDLSKTVWSNVATPEWARSW